MRSKAQTAELRVLLQCTQQDLAVLRSQQRLQQHAPAVVTAAAAVPSSPTESQQQTATALTTAVTTQIAKCATATDDDECVLHSAQNGVTTILKFLSPKQTILFLAFLQDIIRQYSRTP